MAFSDKKFPPAGSSWVFDLFRAGTEVARRGKMFRSSFVRRVGMLVLIAVGAVAVPAGASPILFLNPSISLASVGDSLTLDVDIDSVTDLYAYQFSVSFDPAILQANVPTEGSFLTLGGTTLFFPGFIDNLAGTITFVGATLQGNIPGVTGGGTLAVLGFNAIGAGVSSISLVLDPTNGDLLLDSSLATIDATAVGGRVTVSDAVPSAVPEPATLTLITIGAIGLVRNRRRVSRG